MGAGLIDNGFTKVTMVFPEKNVMERLFTPEIAQFYEKLYESKGLQNIQTKKQPKTQKKSILFFVFLCYH